MTEENCAIEILKDKRDVKQALLEDLPPDKKVQRERYIKEISELQSAIERLSITEQDIVDVLEKFSVRAFKEYGGGAFVRNETLAKEILRKVRNDK